MINPTQAFEVQTGHDFTVRTASGHQHCSKFKYAYDPKGEVETTNGRMRVADLDYAEEAGDGSTYLQFFHNGKLVKQSSVVTQFKRVF